MNEVSELKTLMIRLLQERVDFQDVLKRIEALEREK